MGLVHRMTLCDRIFDLLNRLLLGARAGGAAAAGQPESSGTVPPPKRLVDRAACSSLVRLKAPTDEAFEAIAGLGFRWVDLSALKWAPHVAVTNLMRDFEAEARRLEKLLAARGLRVANLTFDAVESAPFEQYAQEFEALARLAARLEARLINLMAPSLQVDRADQVAKLRKLQAIAQRHGVILTLETHANQITERPAEARKLCQEIPGLGLTLDPGHYYAGPNQGASFDEVLPFVQGTGFRAGGMSWKEIQLPWGEGPIDFAAIVRKLEAAGYPGFYACEYLQWDDGLDPLVEAKKFLEWMKQF